jgi:hypothetical protein
VTAGWTPAPLSRQGHGTHDTAGAPVNCRFGMWYVTDKPCTHELFPGSPVPPLRRVFNETGDALLSLIVSWFILALLFSFSSALMWIACARGKQNRTISPTGSPCPCVQRALLASVGRRRCHHRREPWIRRPRPGGDGPVQRERSEASSARSLTCRGSPGLAGNVGRALPRAMMGKPNAEAEAREGFPSLSRRLNRREVAGF